MARVEFTQNLQRHLEAPPREAPGATVREVLEAIFADHPRLRGYVLDDQQRLRPHVVVFVDGEALRDRTGLGDAVRPDSTLYVMQALSGGAGPAAPFGGAGTATPSGKVGAATQHGAGAGGGCGRGESA